MLGRIFTAIASALRYAGRAIKQGLSEPVDFFWDSIHHVWDDVGPYATAPFKAAASGLTKIGEVTVATAMTPFAIIGAILTKPATAADLAVKAREEVARNTAEFAERTSTPEPAWSVAKATARAILEGTRRPSHAHLPIEHRAWLDLMTSKEARMVRQIAPEELRSFLAGKRRIDDLHQLPREQMVAEIKQGIEIGRRKVREAHEDWVMSTSTP